MKIPSTIDEIYEHEISGMQDGKKGTLGLVVTQTGKDLKPAITAKLAGLINLRIVGEKNIIEDTLAKSGYSLDDIEIIDAKDRNILISILHEWYQEGEIDVLYVGDMLPLQIKNLLINPYLNTFLEDGISRACVVSLPHHRPCVWTSRPQEQCDCQSRR